MPRIKITKTSSGDYTAKASLSSRHSSVLIPGHRLDLQPIGFTSGKNSTVFDGDSEEDGGDSDSDGVGLTTTIVSEPLSECQVKAYGEATARYEAYVKELDMIKAAAAQEGSDIIIEDWGESQSVFPSSGGGFPTGAEGGADIIHLGDSDTDLPQTVYDAAAAVRGRKPGRRGGRQKYQPLYNDLPTLVPMNRPVYNGAAIQNSPIGLPTTVDNSYTSLYRDQYVAVNGRLVSITQLTANTTKAAGVAGTSPRSKQTERQIAMFYPKNDKQVSMDSLADFSDNGEQTYTCCVCDMVLHNVPSLMRHCLNHVLYKTVFKTKSGNNPNALELEQLTVCSDCYRTFKTPYETQQHRNNVHLHPDLTRVCEICSIDFATSKSLLNHLNDSHCHGEEPYECPVCNAYKTPFYMHLIEHFCQCIAPHVATDPRLLCFFCLRCCKGRGLHAITNYVLHMQKHRVSVAKFKQTKCRRCRLHFVHLKELKKHVQSCHATPSVIQQGKDAEAASAAAVKAAAEAAVAGTTTAQSLLRKRLTDTADARVNTNTALTHNAPTGKHQTLSPEVSPLAGTAKSRADGSGSSSVGWKLLCMECRHPLQEKNHYGSISKCTKCSYVTHCKFNSMNHVMYAHSKQRLQLARQKQLVFHPYKAVPFYTICQCGYKSTEGNLMALHMAKEIHRYCNARSLPSSAAAAVAGTTRVVGGVRRRGASGAPEVIELDQEEEDDVVVEAQITVSRPVGGPRSHGAGEAPPGDPQRLSRPRGVFPQGGAAGPSPNVQILGGPRGVFPQSSTAGPAAATGPSPDVQIVGRRRGTFQHSGNRGSLVVVSRASVSSAPVAPTTMYRAIRSHTPASTGRGVVRPYYHQQPHLHQSPVAPVAPTGRHIYRASPRPAFHPRPAFYPRATPTTAVRAPVTPHTARTRRIPDIVTLD